MSQGKQKIELCIMRCSFYFSDNFWLLSPACGQRSWSGDYKMPSVSSSVRSSCFYINLNISVIYKDIFTKFAGNVYGYENLFVQNFVPHFEKQKKNKNGHHS